MVSVTLINFQLHVFHFLIRILIIREHKKKTKKHKRQKYTLISKVIELFTLKNMKIIVLIRNTCM
jgi:hypothetical protein